MIMNIPGFDLKSIYASVQNCLCYKRIIDVNLKSTIAITTIVFECDNGACTGSEQEELAAIERQINDLPENSLDLDFHKDSSC